MNKKMKQIFSQGNTIISLTEELIQLLREQDFHNFCVRVLELIDMLNQWIQVLLDETEYFKGSRIIKEQDITQILSAILESQQNRDYIKIADIYENGLLPFILEIQKQFIASESIDKADYDTNLEILEEMNPEGLEALKLKDMPQTGVRYTPEYSDTGAVILKAEADGVSFYLHSKKSPEREAQMLAGSWYREHKKEYIIYGFGLGYAVWKLAGLNKKATINIYESDKTLLKTVCEYGDMGNFHKYSNCVLHYDPDFQKLQEKLFMAGEESTFVVHYPSLRCITNVPVRERLYQYFLRYEAIRNQDKNIESYGLLKTEQTVFEELIHCFDKGSIRCLCQIRREDKEGGNS